jgi:hypothetical protein
MHLADGPATNSVYVCDRFLVPAMTPSQQQQLAAGTLSLDSLIRAFVRERLAHRSSLRPTAPRRSSWSEMCDEDHYWW